MTDRLQDAGTPPARIRASAAMLGLGWVGIGLIGLIYRDFLLQYQPVPAAFPNREMLAIACAVLSIGCGLGLLFDRTRLAAVSLLAAQQMFWTVIAQPVSLWPFPAAVGPWIAVAENAVILCALAMLAAYLGPSARSATGGGLPAGRMMTGARWLFAACCLTFAAGHFLYLDFTARMIPGWLPARPLLAGFTGACHLAAALGLLTRRFRRLAAELEALMMGSFVLLVHVPTLWGPLPFFAATYHAVLVALVIAWSLTASAAVMASVMRARDTVGGAFRAHGSAALPHP